jgi:hypothetical protein
MNSTPKIYVAGHRGMVGSAIIRVLNSQRCRAEKPTGAFRRMHPHSTGCTCRLPSQHPAEGAIKPLFRPTSYKYGATQVAWVCWKCDDLPTSQTHHGSPAPAYSRQQPISGAIPRTEVRATNIAPAGYCTVNRAWNLFPDFKHELDCHVGYRLLAMTTAPRHSRTGGNPVATL